jgi:hypothetical protein
MKKSALIISGEYRTFEIVSKFWSIPENYDLYFSTWNYSEEKRKKWISKENNEWSIKQTPFGEKCFLTFTDEIFQNEVKNRFPVNILEKTKSILIHDKNIQINSKWNDFRSQIFHWKTALVEIEKNWYDYENILHFRIDGLVWIFENSFDWFEEDTIVTPSDTSDFSEWTFFNDTWFGGKKEVVKKFINTFSLANNLEVHGDVARNLRREILELKSFKHKSMNEYDKKDLNYNFVRFGMIEWLEEYYHNIFKHNPIFENFPLNNEEFKYYNEKTRY